MIKTIVQLIGGAAMLALMVLRIILAPIILKTKFDKFKKKKDAVRNTE